MHIWMQIFRYAHYIIGISNATYIWMQIFRYAHMNADIQICTYECRYSHMHMHEQICTYECRYSDMHIWMQICTYMQIWYAHIQICTYECRYSDMHILYYITLSAFQTPPTYECRYSDMHIWMQICTIAHICKQETIWCSQWSSKLRPPNGMRRNLYAPKLSVSSRPLDCRIWILGGQSICRWWTCWPSHSSCWFLGIWNFLLWGDFS